MLILGTIMVQAILMSILGIGEKRRLDFPGVRRCRVRHFPNTMASYLRFGDRFMEDYYYLTADGRISDAYKVKPEWFTEADILLVCIDSERDPGLIRKLCYEHWRLDVELLAGRVLMKRHRAESLFASPDTLCGFDALYTLTTNEPLLSPTINSTTECIEWDSEVWLRSLAAEMRSCGATSYFADGCGLACVSADLQLIQCLETGLASTAVKVLN
jgi:hypothetical protein